MTRDNVWDREGWAQGDRQAEIAALNDIAASLALGYHRRELSWQFCDNLINSLWGDLIHCIDQYPEGEWPTLFSDVYDAFDAGEFLREGKQDENPMEVYTRPEIARIVEENGLAG